MMSHFQEGGPGVISRKKLKDMPSVENGPAA